ncbi:MAG: DUF2087 domain-containing protein [Acidimicrobiia bacterium]
MSPKTYDEREVNRRLQVVHPDHAALRRYLVDEELMTRADGAYWRSGGRVRLLTCGRQSPCQHYRPRHVRPHGVPRAPR